MGLIRDLFVPRKTNGKAPQPDYGTDMRAIEQWAKDLNGRVGGIQDITSVDGSVTITNPRGPVVDLHASGGSGGGYASLTGPGETVSPGALTQNGNFTIGFSGSGFAFGVSGATVTFNLSSGFAVTANGAVSFNAPAGPGFTWTCAPFGSGSPNLTFGPSGGGPPIFQLTGCQDITMTALRSINISADASGSGNGSLTLTAPASTGGTIVGGHNERIGFYGFSGGPAGVQIITGSRGGNAALANLLAALSSFGLIQDATTP
jgi:hypothetical protein